MLDATGLRFGIYDLRHTFATRMAERGMDLATLAAILGHSGIRVVQRYIHITQEHQRAAMRRFGPQSWQFHGSYGRKLKGIGGNERELQNGDKCNEINAKQRVLLEARVGIEPTNKGFADLCLTTWLPRPGSDRARPVRRERHLSASLGPCEVQLDSEADRRFVLERETGLEPATSTLARSHSTN